MKNNNIRKIFIIKTGRKHTKIKSIKIKNILCLILILIFADVRISAYAETLENNNVSKNSDINEKVNAKINDRININIATVSKIKKNRVGVVNEKDGAYIYDEKEKLLKDFLYKTKSGNIYYSDKNGKVVGDTFVAVDARTNNNMDIYDTNTHWYYFDNSGKAIKGRSTRINGRKFTFDKYGYIDEKSEGFDILKQEIKLDFSDKKVGDVIYFGRYDYYEDKYAPITFDVLDVKSDKILLSSCYIIDYMDIDKGYKWASSDLRKWLNGIYDEELNFLKDHFNEDELNMIIDTDIYDSGIHTKDKIFILSEDEYKKYHVDKIEKYKTTFPTHKTRSKQIYVDDNHKSPYCLRDNEKDIIKVVDTLGNVALSSDYIDKLTNPFKKNNDDKDDDIDNNEVDSAVDYENKNIYGIRIAMWIKKQK